MHLEELSFSDVTVRLDHQLTVITDLDAPARHQWVRRVLGALQGTPPGYGTSLVLRDGSSRKVRLTRDPDGTTRAVDVESGEDLTGDLGENGRLDWLAFLGLDPATAQAMMIVGQDAAETEAAGEDLVATGELLARVEAEYEETQGEHDAVLVLRQRLASVEERLRRRAVEALETARDAFGDRPRLGPSEVERGLLLPTQPPAELEELHRAYLVVAQHRAEAEARLEEAAPDMAPPSAPWVPTLARTDLTELWARAEGLRSARTRVGEIAVTRGGIGGDTIARIEAAHAEVEKAEISLERARITCRAARRDLAEAQAAEQEILARAGFESWLGFRLWRSDVLVGLEVDEALEAAEAELQRATDAWTEMAGVVEVEEALAVREEVESYAAQLAQVGSGDTEAVCRDALEKAETAYLAARTALLEACGPYAPGELERAPEEVAALVAMAIHARLQRALEEAEAAEEATRQGAWETGASAPGTRGLWEERAGLLQQLAAAEADMARAASLAERGNALRHRISVLESSTVPSDDPETALLNRFAAARRVGPRGEPLPLVFDDALVGYRREDKRSLLDLLARLAEAVQVVYLTDDPEAAEWARARSRQGGVAFLEPSPPPAVTCRDCGKAPDCLVQVADIDLCTACALARVGVRHRSRDHRAQRVRRGS